MPHSLNHHAKKRLLELDGLRALAVVSVILFHCEVGGLLSAGFLGVDMFFMISGFIITSKLMADFREPGKFRFAAFYFNRLKRLLPPVAGLLVLAGGVALTDQDTLDQFRWDVPAALAYASNWWQLYHEQPYFSATPVVLKHLWSLAVEEQFYVIWPVVAYFAVKHAGQKKTSILAALLALGSTAWMAALYSPDSASALKNALYLGSHTHAMGLFAGAALAGFWNPWNDAERSTRACWSWRCAALVALAVLGWMMQSLHNETPFIYQGGLLAVPLLTGVVAYTTIGDRRFFVSWLFRTRVVQWLGVRSYSLYLVHWPVFALMRLRGFDDFSDPAVLAGGLLAVAVLAEILFQCTEAPMKKIATSAINIRQMTISVCAYTAAAAMLFVWVMLHGNPAPNPATESQAAQSSAREVVADGAPGTPAATAAPGYSDEQLASNERISGGADIFAIGDSVLKGAQRHLEKVIPGIEIDAVQGRQASEGLKVLKAWRAAGGKAKTVLVHLGTNGNITESQYRALLAELADRERVLLVNVRVPKPWMKPNNEIIARMPADYPNVRVIDWNTLSAQQPAFFVKDNTHLTMKGIRALSAQIKDATGGSVIMPASEQDTMLAKGKESARQANVPAPAPPAPAPAPHSPETAVQKDAPAHKETPARKETPAAPPDSVPPAAHEAAEKPADHAQDHLAQPAPPPAEAPPVD